MISVNKTNVAMQFAKKDRTECFIDGTQKYKIDPVS